MKKQPPIQKSDALALFGGNQAALARAAGVTRQAINKIKEDGSLTEKMALRLRFISRPEVFDPRGNIRIKHNNS